MANDLTPERALEILGVSAAASSDERHRVFREKLGILEKKLGQAPTDGLKAKYRDAIRDLEQAIETLELAQTESDLGSVRPDLKPAAESAPRPGSEVARGVPAPPPNAANTAKGLAAPPSSRAKSQREFRLALLGVAVVVVLLGGWWWKQSADATTERARQEELAKQEAIARTARDSVERAAAEARAAALRNDEDRRKESDRLNRTELATITAVVDTELAALDQQAAAVEREISRMDSEARELARGSAGWELDYTRERKRLLLDYAGWLKDLTVRHPARIARHAARDLGNAEPEAALAKAREAQAAIAQVQATLIDTRAAKVGVPLWTLAVRQRGEAATAALQRVASEEAESGKVWAADEKKRLAYLETGKPRGDEAVRLRAIALALGPDDADLARWVGAFQPKAGAAWTLADLGLRMNYLAPGTFTMGSPGAEAGRDDDEVAHRVTLARGFWIGTTEITQGHWRAVMGTTIRQQRDKLGPTELLVGEGDNLPMYYVNWDEATEFCQRLTERERAAGRLSDAQEYCLPTEAQWEFACRAGSTGATSAGNLTLSEDLVRAPELGAVAWYVGNSTVANSDQTATWTWTWEYRGREIPVAVDRGAAHAVAGKQPNAWGLYDMHGNVWEWCHDWYGDYSSGAVTDPTGPASGTYRVFRGGGWRFPAPVCRSAFRGGRDSPGRRNFFLGFRLVLSSIP